MCVYVCYCRWWARAAPVLACSVHACCCMRAAACMHACMACAPAPDLELCAAQQGGSDVGLGQVRAVGRPCRDPHAGQRQRPQPEPPPPGKHALKAWPSRSRKLHCLSMHIVQCVAIRHPPSRQHPACPATPHAPCLPPPRGVAPPGSTKEVKLKKNSGDLRLAEVPPTVPRPGSGKDRSSLPLARSCSCSTLTCSSVAAQRTGTSARCCGKGREGGATATEQSRAEQNTARAGRAEHVRGACACAWGAPGLPPPPVQESTLCPKSKRSLDAQCARACGIADVRRYTQIEWPFSFGPTPHPAPRRFTPAPARPGATRHAPRHAGTAR